MSPRTLLQIASVKPRKAHTEIHLSIQYTAENTVQKIPAMKFTTVFASAIAAAVASSTPYSTKTPCPKPPTTGTTTPPAGYTGSGMPPPPTGYTSPSTPPPTTYTATSPGTVAPPTGYTGPSTPPPTGYTRPSTPPPSGYSGTMPPAAGATPCPKTGASAPGYAPGYAPGAAPGAAPVTGPVPATSGMVPVYPDGVAPAAPFSAQDPSPSPAPEMGTNVTTIDGAASSAIGNNSVSVAADEKSGVASANAEEDGAALAAAQVGSAIGLSTSERSYTGTPAAESPAAETPSAATPPGTSEIEIPGGPSGSAVGDNTVAVGVTEDSAGGAASGLDEAFAAAFASPGAPLALGFAS